VRTRKQLASWWAFFLVAWAACVLLLAAAAYGAFSSAKGVVEWAIKQASK